MQNIKELQRRPAPGSRPQPLAFHRRSLWIGSWDTDQIYEIEPNSGTVLEEIKAPGKPYGIAVLGDDLRVVVSIGEADDRYFFRFVPGAGFDLASKTACPDFTGSHLASEGATLYLGQMGNRRILALDGAYNIQREIPLPARIGGMGFSSGTFYVISGNEELENLHLATLDLLAPEPEGVQVAAIPFDARCLAFDGKAWWTSHREVSEIVSFTV